MWKFSGCGLVVEDWSCWGCFLRFPLVSWRCWETRWCSGLGREAAAAVAAGGGGRRRERGWGECGGRGLFLLGFARFPAVRGRKHSVSLHIVRPAARALFTCCMCVMGRGLPRGGRPPCSQPWPLRPLTLPGARSLPPVLAPVSGERRSLPAGVGSSPPVYTSRLLWREMILLCL